MLFFPSRQVAIELFGFSIHWYGLMYLAAFLVAFILLPKLQKYRKLSLSKDEWSSILSSTVIGVIVGGRLGYVLFYDPQYFVQYPGSIIAVWEGGMSFHGGLIGVAAALVYSSKRHKVSLSSILDIAIVPACIGLALGRLGNFINLELFGTLSTVPWAMEFPGAEGLRHPVQLYAVAKNLVLAYLCYKVLQKSTKAGLVATTFLLGYGVLRFSVEFMREPTHPLIGMCTRGQVLSVCMIVAALTLYRRVRS